MTRKVFILLAVTFLGGLVFFLHHRKRTEGDYLFRLMDHFQEIEFVQSPYPEFLKQGKIIKESEAVATPPQVEKFIMDRINHDLTAASPIHPFKLKTIKARMSPNAGIGLRTENVIFAPPPTIFQISRKLGAHPLLRLGYALVNETWEDAGGSVFFRIQAEDLKRHSKDTIFAQDLLPQRRRDKGWIEDQVDLSRYANREMRFIFETLPGPGSKSLWAAWVNPIFIENSDPRRSFNVILISIDTLRFDHLSCYGYGKQTTPHIDQMAKDGVLFKDNIAQAPYTMSSHMSLLTSLYPSFHGVNKLRESYLDSKVTTLAEALYNQGYRTWAITGGGQLSANYGFAEGFETFIEYNHRSDVKKKVNETIEFLEKEKKNNFFIFFHTFRPHAPYLPPPPYDTMFDPDYKGTIDGKTSTINDINSGRLPMTPRDLQHLEALYDGEIRQTDDGLQPLFEYIKKEHLDSNTLIVITSDHGEEFGEHGKVALHSHTLYDELLRIPLIMILPKALPRGKVIEDQVRSIDIAPTILDVLHAPKEETWQGRSLVSLIKDGSRSGENYAYSERLPTDNIYLRSVRTPNSKFIYEEDKDEHAEKYFYFNLKEDPHEQKNSYVRSSLSTKIMGQFQFLIQEERNSKKVVRRQELDEQTLETLKSLGYINQ